MVSDTPRKREIRKNLAREFGDNWQNDYAKKQIVRKPRSFIKRVLELLTRKKFTVFALYWWAKYDRAENEMSQKFYFPLKHDNTPIPGVPMKYELQGGWTINEDDLGFLMGGPLVSEGQTDEILVPVDQGLKKIQRLARSWGPVVTIFLGVATFILRIVGFI